MKKTIAVLLLISMFFAFSSFSTFAIDEAVDNVSTIYLEDCSYLVIRLSETTFSRATNTKKGTKTIAHYNNDDEKCWDSTITGTFTYTGSSSTCTAASITYNIYNDDWKMKSATASKSSNQAVGNITAKRYTLGIPVQTVEKTFYLTCSATGKLS